MSYARGTDVLGDFIRAQLATGFVAADAIAERAADAFELADDDPRIGALLGEAMAARARELAAWPAVTDCDRLDGALASLDAGGVLARQHFACCNTCGHAEMADEIFAARAAGRRVDGYVFYHWQDTDAAVAGEGIRLRYAAVSGEPAAAVAIGDRVVNALAGAALHVAWDRDPSRTIELTDFAWKRRAPPPPAAVAPPLARWIAALPSAAAAEVAGLLGADYATALVRVGAVDAAIAWGRAAGRLAHVAPRVPARTTELLREAYDAARWGSYGDLIDVLLAGGLGDLELRPIARARVRAERDDAFGAAAAAWYVARSVDDRGLDARLLERALAGWARAGGSMLEDQARTALAAALWQIAALHGADPADAAAYRAAALEGLTHAVCTGETSFARRAVLAAATATGDLDEVARLITAGAPEMLAELVEAYVALGRADDALAATAHAVAARAHLAHLAASDPRAAGWLADARAEAAELPAQLEEGLVTEAEVRAARLALAADVDELAAIAAAVRAEANAAVRAPYAAQLAAVAAGERALACLPPPAPATDGALAKARARWSAAAGTRTEMFRARRAAELLAGHTAALASGGDPAAARALLADVLGPVGETTIAAEPIVVALVALGDLDRAAARADASWPVAAAALAALVPALVAADRLAEARGFVARGLDRARTRGELVEQAPGVLAIAADRRAAAAEMLAAWTLADAAFALPGR